MPAEEFIMHQEFFNKYKWGIESDMLSQIFAQVLGSRVGKPVKTPPHEWKDLAFYQSGAIKKKGSDAQQMRNAFMMMAKTIGREIKHGDSK